MLGNIYCTIHRDTVREVNVIVGEITEEQQKKLERKVSRAMSAGLQVEWPDGSRQWIDIHPLYNFDASDAGHLGTLGTPVATVSNANTSSKLWQATATQSPMRSSRPGS